MGIGETIINSIQLIYGIISEFFVPLGPPIIVSLLTAVVSVQLTFWYHDHRDRRNALKAFQSEIHLNDKETEMMIHDIFKKRNGFEDDSNTRNTVRLAISGYETLKNSGTLTRMPERAKKSIRSYYTILRLINRTLQQREDVRYNLPSSKRDHAIETVDSQLLTNICTICGPTRLELVADRLKDNDEVEGTLREYSNKKAGRDLGGIPIYGDYEEVSHHISNELESLRILPHWTDLKEKLFGY
ncbi:hypothetical protein A4G99_16100 [Haladaptatus sp. R4]|uniref:hypothetical protein n=1 Tax=Haladaptatus sp. R4 TaxID=1679489 RepID=UPI0007B49560|nr:hypothetical protein [Haladaptatus sp. R4]KZN23040.1 hypothetical protein A4G99_16100 [Haladaptatus sp. R4]